MFGLGCHGSIYPYEGTRYSSLSTLETIVKETEATFSVSVFEESLSFLNLNPKCFILFISA